MVAGVPLDFSAFLGRVGLFVNDQLVSQSYRTWVESQIIAKPPTQENPSRRRAAKTVARKLNSHTRARSYDRCSITERST
jgi:hypothetical protein